MLHYAIVFSRQKRSEGADTLDCRDEVRRTYHLSFLQGGTRFVERSMWAPQFQSFEQNAIYGMTMVEPLDTTETTATTATTATEYSQHYCVCGFRAMVTLLHFWKNAGRPFVRRCVTAHRG